MTHATSTNELRALGTVYEETRQRVVNLVREMTFVDPDAASTPTAACPGWRVRDVIAHLSGLATDIASGNIDGAATDAWTAAQVDARRGLSVGDLLDESDDVGPRLAAFVDDFPGRYGAQVTADIAVHEQDIRGALGRPAVRDSAGVAHCLDFLLETFVAPGARALGVPALQIRAGAHVTIVGGYDDPSGDPTAAIQAALDTLSWPPDPAATVAPTDGLPQLHASPFELFRSFTGRRSLAQVHRLGWTTDPAPYDGLFGLWPFTCRSIDLVE
jgi:uncharacterized protein (TIGR03083 family)